MDPGEMTKHSCRRDVLWHRWAEFLNIYLDIVDPDVLKYGFADRVRERFKKRESTLRHDVRDSTYDRAVVDRVGEIVTQRRSIHVVGEVEIDLEGLRPILLARQCPVVTKDAQATDLHFVDHPR